MSEGASVTIRDPRVTSLAQWFWNIVGGLMVVALTFVANNLYQVNLTLAADAVTKQQMAQQLSDARARLDAHDQKLEGLASRVSTIEGKTFRGVSGYERK